MWSERRHRIVGRFRRCRIPCRSPSACSTSTSSTVVCVTARCASSRASRRPNSSRRPSPISPRARPVAFIPSAHRRRARLEPNPRPPHHRARPDCVHRRVALTLRLISCTRHAACLAASHHCRFHHISTISHRLDREMAVLRPATNLPATTSILPGQRRSAGCLAYSFSPRPRSTASPGSCRITVRSTRRVSHGMSDSTRPPRFTATSSGCAIRSRTSRGISRSTRVASSSATSRSTTWCRSRTRRCPAAP